MKRHGKLAHAMVSLVESYLAKRCCLGFDLAISGQVLMNLTTLRGYDEHRTGVAPAVLADLADPTPVVWQRASTLREKAFLTA
jgi:hypothetical protein